MNTQTEDAMPQDAERLKHPIGGIGGLLTPFDQMYYVRKIVNGYIFEAGRMQFYAKNPKELGKVVKNYFESEAKLLRDKNNAAIEKEIFG